MIEPSMRVRAKTLPWSSPPSMSFYTRKEPEMVFNKAFSSLSFRGKRGYPTNILKHREKASNTEKASTYGAILKTEDEQGHILYALVQGRYTGKWSFPKGHSNEGEQPLACTLREVAEETGIDELPPPKEYLQIGYGHYFIFNIPTEIPLIPRDTHEIMNTKWMTVEEMKETQLNADASQFVKMLTNN